MRRVGALAGLSLFVLACWILFRYEPPSGGAPSDGAGRSADGVNLPGALASRSVAARSAAEDSEAEHEGRGCEACVEVVDFDGRPVLRATVSVWPLEGSTFTSWDTVSAGKTDEAGAARLTGLDTEHLYRLGILPPPNREDVLGLTLASWKPSDGRHELGRAFAITGEVIDPSGNPVPQASVLCRAEGYRGQGVLASERGCFKLTGLREGPVTLTAVPDSWALTAAGGLPVTVSAGSEGVTLTLQPDVDMSLRIMNWPVGPLVGTLRVEGRPDVRRTQRVEVSRRGTARIEGLRPHLTYSLSFRGPLGEYLPWVRGIPGGRSNYSVELERGLTITGKLIAPEGDWSQHRAYALGHGLYVRAEVDEEGGYRLGGLLPGTWTVSAHAIQEKPFAFAFGTVKVQAGETADIELTKR